MLATIRLRVAARCVSQWQSQELCPLLAVQRGLRSRKKAEPATEGNDHAHVAATFSSNKDSSEATMNSSAENNSGSIQAKEKKRGQGQAHELKRKPWQDNKGNRIKEAPQSLSAFWLSKIKDISKGNLSNPEKVDDLMLAYKELSNHPKPYFDVAVYNHLIGALASCRNFAQASFIFQDATRREVPVDAYTLSNVYNAATQDPAASVDDLLAVHEQSLDDKLPRNTVSYNALLTSLLKHGEHDVMTEIFKSMTKDYMRDCKPDATTMSLLLKAATTSGDVSNLNFVWRYARLSNLVDWYIVGIMADMLAAVSISSPQKRQELLKLLHDYVRVAQGSKQRAPLRQQTCRTIIASAVVLADSLEELAKLVRQLQKYADDTTDVSREAIISVTSHDATRIRNGLKPRAAGTRIAQLLNRDRTVEDDVMVMKSTSQPDQANLAAKTKTTALSAEAVGELVGMLCQEFFFSRLKADDFSKALRTLLTRMHDQKEYDLYTDVAQRLHHLLVCRPSRPVLRSLALHLQRLRNTAPDEVPQVQVQPGMALCQLGSFQLELPLDTELSTQSVRSKQRNGSFSQSRQTLHFDAPPGLEPADTLGAVLHVHLLLTADKRK